MKDTIAVRNKIINLVTELPTLNERMKKIGFLKQKRQELDEELNIRLALTHVLMANDYRVRHLGPRFAYAIGDLKAVNTYTKRHSNRRLWQESKIITDTLDCLINKYNEVNELYASFEFKDENMIFEMPIKDAEIKRIGSYDARRTRGAGGLSFPGNHQGIDIFSLDSLDYSVIMGTPVSPAKEGFIYNVGYSESYGNMIIVWHDAMTTTLYAHLQNDEVFKRTKELFNNGDLFVTPDDIIGSVGRSGNIPTNGDPYDYPHLHFEIRKNGTPQDPLLSLNDEPHVRRYFH
jgi:murein DD-endopeptidase MepM/ murein hydrolase activator NlpD